MKVSVVIPAYNSEDLIIDAIESVYNQTADPCYQLHEVIVVDDGSGDRTEEVVQAYKEDGRRDTLIYIKQSNSGPSAARNAGMRRATGDLIALLDADDLWMPDKLKLQSAQLLMDRSAGIAYGQFINRVYKKNGGYFEYPVVKRFYKGDIKKELLRCNFIGTSTVMIRREVIDRVGLFNPQLRLAEDYDYWLRIADQYPAVYSDVPILMKRYYGEQNVSGGRSLKMLMSTRDVISSHIHTLNQAERSDVLKAQDISEIQTFILLGDRPQAYRKIAASRTSGLTKLKYGLLAIVPIKWIHYLIFRRNMRIISKISR